MGIPITTDRATDATNGHIISHERQILSLPVRPPLSAGSGQGRLEKINTKQLCRGSSKTSRTNELEENIGCLNIAGGLPEKTTTLADLMQETKIQYLVITETKHSVEMKFTKSQNNYCLTSYSNSTDGIGILSTAPIKNLRLHSTRILSFETPKNIRVLAGYAPHDARQEEERVTLFEQLQQIATEFHPTVLLGDFNAGHETANLKGIRNLTLLEKVISVPGLKLLQHNQTWRHRATGKLRTLDRIATPNEWQCREANTTWTPITDYALLYLQTSKKMMFQRHRRPYYNRTTKQQQTSSLWTEMATKIRLQNPKYPWRTEKPVPHPKRKFMENNPIQAVWQTKKDLKPKPDYTMVNEQGKGVPLHEQMKAVAAQFENI